MKKKIVITVLAVLILSGIIAVNYLFHKPMMKKIAIELPNDEGSIRGLILKEVNSITLMEL